MAVRGHGLLSENFFEIPVDSELPVTCHDLRGSLLSKVNSGMK